MKEELVHQATEFYSKTFKGAPERIFLSPGRINIIGEHIDYNDGFVLPAAIDKYVCIAISANADTKCILVSKDLDDSFEFDLNDAIMPAEKMWANYFLGVAFQLKERNLPLKGFKLVFTSDIPIGAGLSSSAALECSFGFAVNELFNLGVSKKDLALIGQKAEHTFVGVQCGIMDQFASVFGKENHVIKLDCNSLEYEYYSADFQGYALLLLNSNVEHALHSSEYNKRRQEVEKGLSIINDRFPNVKTFRDCNEQQVDELKEELGETIFKRCRFVVREIKRVTDAVEALKQNDFKQLGSLMYETNDGLSKEYEVSCAETDFLVDAVRTDPSVAGSRMMGGGFGGCTINLVLKGHEDELIKRVSAEYKTKFNIDLKPYKVAISDGTSEYPK
ncbi:MAG TPA: galactokinase [Flavobacterium sp.]|jgi:galactokinase